MNAAPDQRHDEEVVTIARFDRPVDAHLARGRLEVAGIPAIVINDGIDNLSLYNAVERGVVRLQVHASRREEAKEILGEVEQETQSEPRCPHCDSARISRRFGSLSGVFGLFLLGAWVRNLGQAPYHCHDCGARWRA